MTYALPPAAPPPPRRQVFIGTTLASVAALMFMGGMLAVWLLQRQRSLDLGESWVPSGTEIPGVQTTVMLIGICTAPVFAQWAVYATRRRDRVHVGIALGLVFLIGLAVVNAQAYVYGRMDLAVAGSGYAGMFYAITGAMVALIVVGMVFTGVTAFRVLGGHERDGEVVASHALYWYVLAAIFSAVWLIVFVTK